MVDIDIIALTGDDPEAAKKAGCTATSTVFLHQSSGGDIAYDYTYWQLRAEGKKGWRFVRFEWSFEVSDNEGYRRTTTPSQSLNPWPQDGGSRDNHLYDGYMEISDSSGYYFREDDRVVSCKAYFRRDPGSGLILCNLAGVILHGKNGTILYDD